MIQLYKPILPIHEDTRIFISSYDVHQTRYMINPYGLVIDIYNNKFIDQYIDIKGYYYVTLQSNTGKYKRYYIHRLVAAAYCTKLYDHYNIVNHIDGVKTNNFCLNLEWCNEIYNSMYAIYNGLINPFTTEQVRGEANVNAYLTEELVHIICQELVKGTQYAKISEIIGYGYNNSNICDIITKIRSKKLWRHISDLYQIPEKEARSKATVYTDEQIHLICAYLQQGYSAAQIAKVMGIDIGEYGSPEYYNWSNLIGRIRRKTHYTHISNQYNIACNSIKKEKLSDDIIHMICECIQRGLLARDIAKELNIDIGSPGDKSYENWKCVISRIRNRKGYTHISKGYVW
ncbi:MAG: hypothetical protein ACRCXT_02980 [Paraclostridium sp.]